MIYEVQSCIFGVYQRKQFNLIKLSMTLQSDTTTITQFIVEKIILHYERSFIANLDDSLIIIIRRNWNNPKIQNTSL